MLLFSRYLGGSLWPGPRETSSPHRSGGRKQSSRRRLPPLDSPAGPAPRAERLESRLKLGQEVGRYLRDGNLSGRVRSQPAPRGERARRNARRQHHARQRKDWSTSFPDRVFGSPPLRAEDIADVYRVHAFVAGLLAEAAAPSSPKHSWTSSAALTTRSRRSISRSSTRNAVPKPLRRAQLPLPPCDQLDQRPRSAPLVTAHRQPVRDPSLLSTDSGVDRAHRA